jgi:hypothetical protein
MVNLYIPHNRRTPFQAEEALGPIFLYPGVPVGLTPFRGLGQRNLVPILPPAHPMGGGQDHRITLMMSGSIGDLLH